jgi:predicted anti-sigma-YlaC factor YlaD
MRLSDHHADIDGYVAGDLDPEAARLVEEHLARCHPCNEEVRSLREVQRLLATVPVEAVLEGPPEDADLLLQRTLRRVRAEESGASGRRTRWAAAVVGTVAAAALCIGVVVGWSMADSRADAPGAASVGTDGPGTRFASATDPSTGARISVRVVPAAGWVRVNAAVGGIPAGQTCHLIVVGRDGDREMAGGWRVSRMAAAQGTTLSGAAPMDPAAVSKVIVESTSGRQLVSTSV